MTSCPASKFGSGPSLSVVAAKGSGGGAACYETLQGVGGSLFFVKGGQVCQTVVNVPGAFLKGPAVEAAEKALAFDAIARL